MEKSGKTWSELLSEEFQHVCLNVVPIIRNKPFQPNKTDIFKAFKLCSFDDTKVVIVGQDPYYTPGVPTGLAFATNDGSLPSSLLSIFKEVELCYQCFLDRSKTDLTGWANQGVLLLNTVLTVEPGKPLSHYRVGWQNFTRAAIGLLGSRETPTVFMLWGNEAQKLESLIGPQHLILSARHPSSAAAGKSSLEPFAGCRHFSKANEWLIANKREPIVWQNL
jgi:uracil-DNA glycosylase